MGKLKRELFLSVSLALWQHCLSLEFERLISISTDIQNNRNFARICVYLMHLIVPCISLYIFYAYKHTYLCTSFMYLIHFNVHMYVFVSIWYILTYICTSLCIFDTSYHIHVRLCMYLIHLNVPIYVFVQSWYI